MSERPESRGGSGASAPPPLASLESPAGPPRPTAVWHVMTALWALAALLLAVFGHRFATAAVVLPIGGLLALIWCFQAARVLLHRETRSRLTPRAMIGWAAYPATAILLSSLVLSHWVDVLRVRVSEAALLRLVEDVEAGRADFDTPVRAGLFRIEDARIEDGCVLLEVNESWVYLSDGLAFARRGAPPSLALSRHITGPWWEFYYLD